MIALEERIAKIIERQEDMLGNAGLGRAHTCTFRVSPDGTGADGLSWRTAYQTIPTAVAAASADANALTQLLLSTGTHDMDTTGDPDLAKNIVIQGSHRNWCTIVNNHASADTVIGSTGYLAMYDVTVDCGTGDNNGIAFGGTGANGARLERVYIEAEDVTGAHDGIVFVGGVEYIAIKDVRIHGVKAHTTGVYFNNCTLSLMERVAITDCATGLNLSNAGSDNNAFAYVSFGNCTIGININGGNNQFFYEITFAGCTMNVDDDIADHIWINIHGFFPIYILPDNFVGITVNTGAANVYGGDTELIAAAAIGNPFRVVGTHFEPSASEWYKVRFTGDSGAIYYDEIQFDGTKREGAAAPSGTEFIFNADSRMSCSAKSESGGNNVQVWIEIQEI